MGAGPGLPAVPVDEQRGVKTALMIRFLALPSFFVSWLMGQTRRTWVKKVGIASLVIAVAVGVVRGTQWALEGQLA